ncbi:MAG: Gfo/Idh/MocA family oxidoreductase [Verrucomicrobiae bacterium]|nr:Gfo/Idh/MocA family oxidoreductase [Verrucomicrobiae bacterium]
MHPLSSSPGRPVPKSSRRRFLASGSAAAAGAALSGLPLPAVHASGSDTLRMALIGCGGRGSGAVANALEASGGPVRLVAMADLFENRLTGSHHALSGAYGDRIDVPPDRRFIGFDAFRHAIDCLRPGSGDIALLTGYAGFRPAQLEYAVQRGVHVFMEKSFATDPPGVRRILRAGEEADRKGLKIAAGLMCRHSRNRQELIRRIRDGELGDILMIRAYRMEASGPLGRKPEAIPEIEWQLRNFTKFLWVSGGLFAEMDIHQVDEICWIKDAWPVNAHGVGGRVANSTDCSQNLDSFSAEWTFPDGTRAFDVVRYIPRCHDEFATYIHGTRRAAQFSGNIHAATVRIFKDQRIERGNLEWEAPREETTAWQAQWNDLLHAIRHDLPLNQARPAALSNLTMILGRAAIHMGRIVSWQEAMTSSFQFCPNLEDLSLDGPVPVQADTSGRYPVPIPGQWIEI